MTGGYTQFRAGAGRTRRAGWGSVIALVGTAVLLGAVDGVQETAEDAGPSGLTLVWLVSLLAVAAGTLLLQRRRRDQDAGTPAEAGLVAGYEDRLHEVRAGLAGVATAVHVLADPDTLLSGVRRTRIEGMLEHEVERLQRLLMPAAAPAYGPVALDDVVASLVTARRLAGQQVHWQAGGHCVLAAEDHVTEVLTTLLVNAGCHAPGSPVWVETSAVGTGVRIEVTDDGPGVPAELRDAVFERGRCGPGSAGEGIGLHVAQELVGAAGGSLQLGAGRGRGASFVVTLPAASVELTG